MLTLDGSLGEGGGQIVRTALALSLVTGTPFAIERIRAGRAKPGLAAQHVAAVRAARAVGAAVVEGAEVGSQALRFTPYALQGGDYELDVGTAGSTTLVLQTVLPALLRAPRPSTIAVGGGTHNPLAPPFEFVAETYFPALRLLGAEVEVRLERQGFYPKGGGRIVAEVQPLTHPRPLDLAAPVTARPAFARALLVRLPTHIGDRELRVVARELGLPRDRLSIVDSVASSPGNVVLVGCEAGDLVDVTSALGAPGVRAEEVADRAVAEARAFIATGAPVGEHLADQLLVPLAVAAGGRYLIGPPSSHTVTNADTIGRFLPGAVRLRAPDDDVRVVVEVAGLGGAGPARCG